MASPSDILSSVTEVCTMLSCCNPSSMLTPSVKFVYGPLKDELGFLDEKRPRRYANENHLLLYAVQLWARDWFVYQKPETRVSDWELHWSNVFSTSQIGKYIESCCWGGSHRGLYYKVSILLSGYLDLCMTKALDQDVMFICFWKEYTKLELAIQLTKDAKNMSKPHISKR